MDTAPNPNDSFQKYEPEKYNCVTVDDDFVWPLLRNFEVLDTCLHSLSKPAKGLNYCGITLIPPSSLSQFREIIDKAGIPELRTLSEKIEEAIKLQKYMIHFGI